MKHTARTNPLVFILPWLLLLLLLPGCFSNGGGEVVPVDPNNPTPAAKPLWFIAVEDSLTRPQGSILADFEYWESLAAKGHKYAIMDQSNPSAGPYAKYSDKAGIPCLILMRDSDKRVLTFGKVPATTGDVDKLIGKYGRR